MLRTLLMTVVLLALVSGCSKSGSASRTKPLPAQPPKPSTDPNATYKNRTATAWGKRLLDHDPIVSLEAARALVELREHGAPFLVQGILSNSREARESAFGVGGAGTHCRPYYSELTGTLGTLLKSSDEQMQIRTIGFLGDIGPLANDHAAAVERLLADQQAKNPAAVALLQIQEEDAIPKVVALIDGGLKSPEDVQLIYILSNAYPKDKQAEQSLLSILRKPHALGRGASMVALGKMQSPAAAAIMVGFIEKLPSDNEFPGIDRWQPVAFKALKDIGPAAKDVLPRLEKVRQLYDAPGASKEIDEVIAAIKKQ